MFWNETSPHIIVDQIKEYQMGEACSTQNFRQKI